MSPNYHHRFCSVCARVTVHDSGKCIECGKPKPEEPKPNKNENDPKK